jgi:2-polyprenyl-3-methyl-5-hydroxy-6-metoxy-1,4-benzoquinol methylase
MKQKHIEAELKFYDSAFCKKPDLTKINFNWQFQPGIGMSKLFNIHVKPNLNSQVSALDLGIGNGRHAQFFLENGISTITGIDFCSKDLNICKERFQNDPRVQLIKTDLTIKKAIKEIGQFDLVLDWSVMDHIRKQYLKSYIANVVASIKPGGYLIIAAFDLSLPGLWKGKDYKIVDGHYSRGFSIAGLKNLFPSLNVIGSTESTLEDSVNNYRFNTVLFKKEQQ